jgi:signal transduction histidine kinase
VHEIGELAGTMEEMRGQVLRLTTELRRRQAEAEAVLGGITEGVFAVDRERRIRYLNPAAASLLGVAPGEALGRLCGEVLRPALPEGGTPCEAKCPILHARFRGSARATEHLVRADGTKRSVVIASAPPGAPAGGGPDREPQQIQVIRDETEVEATRRFRDTILANISHEFRTPLSAQLASLELLRDRLPELRPEEVQGLVLSIERGTLRLTRLIDNLLESTRIEAGRLSLRRQEVELDSVVEEAIELMAPLVEQRAQRLDVQLPYPLPQILGDPPRLVQVLVNLLANANKFAPEGSRIGIGAQVGEREVRLWLEDEGPGLPPGGIEALFERFTRSAGEEPGASGMGLGLFIVKSIVERHGGRIEAEPLGRGTRMCVILPRGDRREERGDAAGGAAEPPPARGQG